MTTGITNQQEGSVESMGLLESARRLQEWCRKDEGYDHDAKTMKALEAAGYISSLQISASDEDFTFFMTEKLRAL